MNREQLRQFHEEQLKIMAWLQNTREAVKIYSAIEPSKNQDDLENQMVIGD